MDSGISSKPRPSFDLIMLDFSGSIKPTDIKTQYLSETRVVFVMYETGDADSLRDALDMIAANKAKIDFQQTLFFVVGTKNDVSETDCDPVVVLSEEDRLDEMDIVQFYTTNCTADDLDFAKVKDAILGEIWMRHLFSIKKGPEYNGFRMRLPKLVGKSLFSRFLSVTI
jgi:hypothetical protein